MEEIIVSAPGKVILHGEHSVVYGKRALAASLNLRTYLRLTPRTGGLSVRFPDINVSREWSLEDLDSAVEGLTHGTADTPAPAAPELLQCFRRLAGLEEENHDTKALAVLAFLSLYTAICRKGGRLQGAEVLLTSQLPPGAGLGSSAAFATCLSAALLLAARHIQPAGSLETADLDLVNKWAFEVEKVIHGRPSGIDNAVSTYGGGVILHQGNMSHMERVPELSVLLLNTRVPRSTRTLVARVRAKHDKYPEVLGPVLEAMDALSTRSISVYSRLAEDPAQEGHYDDIKELFTLNQDLLRLLGVSHPDLESVIALATEHGLAAKLTGAGGGGCAIAVIPPDVPAAAVAAVRRAAEAAGRQVWLTSVGAGGVRSHRPDDSALPPTLLAS